MLVQFCEFQEIIKRFESGLNKIKEASEHLEESRQRSAEMEEEQRALKERASTLIESVEQMKIKLAKVRIPLFCKISLNLKHSALFICCFL